jgi:hypothetical protein
MIDNITPGILKFFVKLFIGGQLEKIHYYLWEHTPDKFDTVNMIQLWQKRNCEGFNGKTQW